MSIDQERGKSRWLTRYKLETKLAGDNARRPRSDEDEEPDSVIHAPQGFPSFVSMLIETFLSASYSSTERTEIASVQTAFYSFSIAAIRYHSYLPWATDSRGQRKCMQVPY